MDSVKRISLEVGKPYSWYLQDQNVHFNFPNEYKVQYVKLSYQTKRNYFGISFGWNQFYYPDEKISTKGDIISRISVGGSIHYGRVLQHKKLKVNFIPQLIMGFRKGHEEIVIEKINNWGCTSSN